MNILERASTMLQNLKTIFGIPAREITKAQVFGNPPEFMPQTHLPAAVIHGEADSSGEHWLPWRFASDGTLWFRRVVAGANQQIQDADDGDQTQAAMRAFRRECAILKSVNSRRQIDDADDADDADDFGDTDDE